MAEAGDTGGLPHSMQDVMNSIPDNCTPMPDEFFDEFLKSSDARQRAVSIAYGMICVVGLITNAVVIFLLFAGGRKGATFKAPSTILIMNLAVADTLFLLTLPFSISHRLHKGWKFGNAMCKFEQGVKFLNYYGSVFFITAMAIDRFLAITRPVKMSPKTARKSICIASCVLWCLALIAVIPLLIFAGVDEHGFCSIIFPRRPLMVRNSTVFLEALQQVECLEDYYYDNDVNYEPEIADVSESDGNSAPAVGSGSIHDYVVYINEGIGATLDGSEGVLCRHPDIPSLHTWLIWNFVIGFILPFVVISICYVRLMKIRLPVISIYRERQRAVTDSENNNIVGDTSRATISTRNDASKLITLPERTGSLRTTNHRAKILLNILVPCLVASFAICWLPYHLFHLLQIRGVTMPSDTACHVTRDVTFCLAFFNSALNPILNSFFLYNFKQRLQESSSWVSSQLKNLSTKKKSKTGEGMSTHVGSSRDNDETAAMETTLMTFATSMGDVENV